MQIYNLQAEVRALKTITSSKLSHDIRLLWMSRLHSDMFHMPATRMAFDRIDLLAKRRFKIISFKNLVEDPRLDEDVRDMLATTKERPCLNEDRWKETLDVLENFRKIRLVYSTAKTALESLEDSAVDVDSLLHEMAEGLAGASNPASADGFLHFGLHDNSRSIVRKIQNNEVEPRIKTGWKAYDEQNGGLPDQGVIIMAATTSGGKSTVAMNLATYMYFHNNLSVFRLTLEMSDTQETQRFLSHLTQIPMSRFSQGKLTAADSRKIDRARRRVVRHGKKHKIDYSTYSPPTSMSFSNAVRIAKPFGYRVLIVDYVGLLDEDSKQDQWKVLMEVARQAKEYSRETGTLVILLAQLNDDEVLKYSKGMKDHADTLIQWVYSKPEVRETHKLPIRVTKDRNAALIDFELEENFHVMTVCNEGGGGHTEEDEENEEEKSSSALV